ncbi:GNAT family N-acetyltransferase [Dokdonella sp.]|uniref:GNAT family N-acetyltransferase n=1 Tax=Dokdonella sp. TaxID=2291710 RepID=UPI001B1C3A4E|nr:GNAT family N-acetyltransferase [Dokdonella sp.]MBO9662920.1 GNAT family N-acetyltransferase [Dokdonella sp.]
MSVADPLLVYSWVGARSIGRGLPLPVPDRGGLRVDTDRPEERRRYVFARRTEGLCELAESIREPRVALKLAGTREELASLLPARWRIAEPGFMMIRERPHATAAACPDGYRLERSTAGATTEVRILTAHGELAAGGYAIEYAGVFAYDRIVTEAAHRRRGLGRAVMAALDSARRSEASRPVLVATPEGRALYADLGWTLHSPWTTALIPDPAP